MAYSTAGVLAFGLSLVAGICPRRGYGRPLCKRRYVSDVKYYQTNLSTDGGTFHAGVIRSEGGNGSDISLNKTNKKGDIQWGKTLVIPEFHEEPLAIIPTADEGCILTGCQGVGNDPSAILMCDIFWFALTPQEI